MSEQRDDAFRRRALDRAVFFEDEQLQTIAADGVESCSVIGDDVHILYYRNEQAFVDGVLQTRRRPIACLIIKTAGDRAGRALVARATEGQRRFKDEPVWLGNTAMMH